MRHWPGRRCPISKNSILTRTSRECSGNFFIDEEVLREAGVQDLERYAVTPGTPLFNDLFLG